MQLAASVLAILRPQNSISPILAFCFGYICFSPDTNTISGLVQYVFIIFLLNSIATLHNDIIDEQIDKKNHRKSILLDKSISKRQAWQLLFILFVFLAAAVALSDKPEVNTLFSSVFIIGSFAYNARPLQFSRRPISSIVALGVLLGALPVAYGALASDAHSRSGLLFLAAAFLLLRSSTAMLKDYKDIDGDKACGKKTFLVTFGARITNQATIALSLAGGISLLLYLSLYEDLPPPILGVIGLGLFCLIVLRRQLNGVSYERANTVFHQIVKVSSLAEVGILLCLMS